MNTPRTLTVTSTALAALALAACSAGGPDSADEDGTTTVTVAAVGIMSDVTLDIATEQGFFAEEGIEIEISQVAAPPAGLAALQGGQVDIAFSPGVVFANARAQDIPVVIVAGASGFPADVPPGPELDLYDDTGVYVDPSSGFTSLADLEGATIAVNARKANLEATASQALRNAGVDLSTIEWVALDFTSMIESLTSGQVDAAVPVNPFTLQAEEAGMERIASPAPEFFGDGASSFWLTSSQIAEEKSEVVTSFQAAIHKANAYANEHLDESIAAGVEIAGLDVAVEDAGKIYWPLEVTQQDVEVIGDNLVELDFLDAPVDMTDVILPGA
ncbi:ABC transporter substrate-binding protein [Microbacterium suaedae]|uniref:ABC transporter substrate-binding protein n=1 Tax=Microbacterium suaedae TaxID=2067813 RepID=UPI000DA1698C|nr:ABC transporter substrate-binding protein [Microbacterium suaedae]